MPPAPGGSTWRTAWASSCSVPNRRGANNPNLCFNWFQPGDTARGEGEAVSIRAMIAHATKTYDIDPSRVFVTGLSAGAAMANALLAGYPEVFAGGALMAGLPHGAAATMQEAFTAMRHGVSRTPGQWGDAVRGASAHAGPWPRVSIWHGDEDATVSPGVADEVARQWVNVHGAAATPEEERLENGRRRTVWRDAAGEPVVELHRIARMGHGAPLGRSVADGCGEAGPYLLEVGVSSTLEAARAWRLVDGAPRASAPPPAHPPETAPRRPSVPPPREGPGRRKAGLPEGVEAVIVHALRSAGLMK